MLLASSDTRKATVMPTFLGFVAVPLESLACTTLRILEKRPWHQVWDPL
jgi:hypothetical protein